MIGRAPVVVAIAIVACGRPASSPPSPPCDGFARAAERRLADVRREHGFPGLAVGVIVDGDLAVDVFDGVADRGSQRVIGRDTGFQIGSVTKMLVGVLAADLDLRGELDLDTPLSAHFAADELTPSLAVVTVRQIATHTGGIPRYPDNLVRDDGDPIRGFPRSDLLAALRTTVPTSPPGTAWAYSNFGYGILGEVIERRTGRAIASLLDDRVLGPLGMTRSSLELTPAISANLARAYRDDDPRVETEAWTMEALAPAGNMFATLADLARLAGAEMSPDRAPESLRRAFAEAQRIQWTFAGGGGYGLGRFVETPPAIGARLVWHGGDIDGYAATVMVAPDDKIAMVALANTGMGRPFGELSNWLMIEALRACRTAR